MSPRQIADDPGRQQRPVWLGPRGLRWWVDWTFSEWAAGFFVLLTGFVLLVFVVPAGIAVAAATYLAARSVSRKAYPEDPRLAFRLFCGAVAGLCLMISWHPSTWLSPLFLPIAIIAAVALPWIVVPRIGPYIDFNRPIAYWIRLPRLIARGPREQVEQEINPAALGMGIDLQNADQERDYTITRIISPAKGGKSPATKATITKVRKQRIVRRAPGGFIYKDTHYRIEWRTF